MPHANTCSEAKNWQPERNEQQLNGDMIRAVRLGNNIRRNLGMDTRKSTHQLNNLIYTIMTTTFAIKDEEVAVRIPCT